MYNYSYSFIFHNRFSSCCDVSSGSYTPVGSANDARSGVTLAHPFEIAHPSVPTGKLAFVGLINPVISGANLNTNFSAPLSVGVSVPDSNGGALSESGPAGDVAGFVVACALNNLPYEFLQIFVQ